MNITDLEWDERNIEHIARHGINTQEVLDVCNNPHIAEKQGNGRYILSGQTIGGRYLHVVVEKLGKSIYRPVTAFDMGEDYKRRYRKVFGK